MRIDFHPDATRELESSADWYAERSPDAARGFAIEIDAALKKIAGQPERFPTIDGRHQACSVDRYPFQVVFRSDSGTVNVIAVAHAKRRPKYWLQRG